MCLGPRGKEIHLYINIWSEPLGRGIQLWKRGCCSRGRHVLRRRRHISAQGLARGSVLRSAHSTGMESARVCWVC